jgi:hypothetical protein
MLLRGDDYLAVPLLVQASASILFSLEQPYRLKSTLRAKPAARISQVASPDLLPECFGTQSGPGCTSR